MRFELHSPEDGLISYTTKRATTNGLTVTNILPSANKHNGVGVAPFCFPMGLDKKIPGNQDTHAARSFLFLWESKTVEKGKKSPPPTKRTGIFWFLTCGPRARERDDFLEASTHFLPEGE